MIETIAKLPATERKAIFLEAAGSLPMNAEMIEKDFWVCWTLNRIFQDEYLKKILRFKGGTSLSKVFHLIERFSEDIDLILDWDTIRQGEDVIKSSKNQQTKSNEKLLERSKKFISTELKDKITAVVGDVCQVTVDEEDANNLQVKYPKGIDGAYLLPYIKLEIGALASWLPNDNYPIKPYIDGISPKLTFSDIIVPTIVAERTFWEKATILHAEHFRTSKVPPRYSRHYYDLYQMYNAPICQKALNRPDLLDNVVQFKQRFYYTAWAHYDEAKPQTFHLLPKDENIGTLQDDYKKMKNMIFGTYPTFEEIIDSLGLLEAKINAL